MKGNWLPGNEIGFSLFEEEKTNIVNKTMSRLRNVFGGDVQIETSTAPD